MKYYDFKIEMSCIGTGYVCADNLDEAKRRIMNNDYEDIFDHVNFNVQDIISIKESDD